MNTTFDMKSLLKRNSLLQMTWVEAKLFLREPVNAFFTLIFPLIYLFLYGSIISGMPVPDAGSLAVEPAITPEKLDDTRYQ